MAKSPPANLMPLNKVSLCSFLLKDEICPISNAKVVMARIIPELNPAKYKTESIRLLKLATGIKSKKCEIPANPCKKPMDKDAKLLCLADFLCT